MNWKSILANVAGSALAGYNAAILAGANSKSAALAAAGAVVFNLLALFQPQPHKS